MGDGSDLPAVPIHATVIELSENNADRACKCSDDAEFYVVATNSSNSLVLCQAFCRPCFREAPRVEDADEL